MTLQEVIYRRKSFRKYQDKPLDSETIAAMEAFAATMQPLYPEIKVRWKLLDRKQVRCVLPMPWIPPQLLAIYSETTEGYLENVGFLFQQLELWLQARGLGTCWLGLGQPNRSAAELAPDGLAFTMMLAVGYPQDDSPRSGAEEFRRKTLEQISDLSDSRLEPARLAPSSVNSQPWYFVHDEHTIHVYCSRQGLLKHKALGAMNRIDVGIALAHLYVSNPDRFRFFQAEANPVSGYGYIGSISL